MKKIKRKSKRVYIIWGIIDCLLAVITVALLFFTLVFKGNLAPKLFSHRIYLMNTDAFSLVEKNSALIADEVDFDKILPGNIIIFTDGKNAVSVGEVQKVESENQVYTYTVKTDADKILTVGQSHILGKGMFYSRFLGVIISFVTSPAGVCCLAVIPCAAFIIFEIINSARKKFPQPTVKTVKKQYETPTYLPRKETKPEKNAESREKPKAPQHLDDVFEDDQLAFDDERQRLVEAAGLFPASPTKKTEPPKKAPQAARPTVSERDIDLLIQQAKAKHMTAAKSQSGAKERANSAYDTGLTGSTTGSKTHRTPTSVAGSAYRQAQSVSSIPAKQAYTPMQLDIDDKPLKRIDDNLPPKPEQRRQAAHVSPRLSKLDSLLNDDSSSSHYDINDILRNIDKK